MAIGNYYPVSLTIIDEDLFLGTKANSNNTVNYTAQGLVNYLNTNAKVSIGGQLSFKFDTVPNLPKTIFFNGGGGDNTPFSSITQLIVSSTDASGADITVFLNYLVNSEILLSQQNKPDNFGNYRITAYTAFAAPYFYALQLQYIGGNGNIMENMYYDINPFGSSGGVPIPTKTSDLINDGDDGINPFISALALSPYLLSTTAASTYYPIPTGTTSQYIRGNGTLATFPANTFTSLTTTGSSGSSTLISGVLNVPTYTLSGLGGQPQLNGTGFVKVSGTTVSYDNTNYYPYPTGTTVQYVRGDGSLATFPTSSIPTLNQVLTAGNVSLLDAKIGVLYGYDNPSSDYGTMEFYDTGVVIKGATTGHLLFYNDDTGSVRFSNGAYTPILNFAGVGNNVYTFQNSNGTLAFLSDIPSLTGYVPTSRTISTTSPLQGGGDLTTNRTLSILQSSSSQNGYLSSTDWSAFNGKQNAITLTTTGTGAATFVSNVLNIPTPSLSGYVPYTGATTDLNLGSNNLIVNNTFDGFSSVVASASLITLTVASVPSYLVTGSGGQTFKMPNATTIPNGALYIFNNNQSSGAILVNNNSNTLIKSVPSGGNMVLELLDNSTAAGSWDTHFQAPSNVSWSTNTFDYTGSITSATWNGVSIADNRIASSANWNTAYTNRITSLTTTGTSGPATLVGNTLNIPQYSGGGGGASIIRLTSQTLASASWIVVGGYYTYTFSNINITVNTRVDFTPNNASYTEVTTCGMLPQVDVSAGGCTFYTLFPPQNNIVGEITIIPVI